MNNILTFINIQILLINGVFPQKYKVCNVNNLNEIIQCAITVPFQSKALLKLLYL